MVEFHILLVLYIIMIKWLKRSLPSSTQPAVPEPTHAAVDLDEPQDAVPFFIRLKQGLVKSKFKLGQSLSRLLLGKRNFDQSLFDELETVLLSSDLGVHTTQALLTQLKEDLQEHHDFSGELVFDALKKRMKQILDQSSAPYLKVDVAATASPLVILMVGVNGAGKTTTIGKLAKRYQQEGKRVLLAAADTFRAAAIEQLQAWGLRNQITVIAQHTGADSASVSFDAFQAAKARGFDVLIVDTAGRLHTQNNLMDELKKIKRVLQKIDPHAPHEILLVLDATTGQNALNQAREFHKAIGLTGLALTKLDGTAKGGILFAIVNELGIPLRYVGVGEGIDDLQPFDSVSFIDAIFSHDHL